MHWQCTTFLNRGKNKCPATQIPEKVLYALCCDVLGLETFAADRFEKGIAEILVTGPNKAVFNLRDGGQLEKTWQPRSRSESWTVEMRRAARERVKGECKDGSER